MFDIVIVCGCDVFVCFQQFDGSWCFEFEFDVMIIVEYILMMYFMDWIDDVCQEKMVCYLCVNQWFDMYGVWDLYVDGVLDVLCSVKVYFVLKVVGDSEQVLYMICVCDVILKFGGVVCLNVFICILFVMFGQVLWCVVLFMLIEFVLFLKWVLILMYKVVYWVCMMMVLLLVLCLLKVCVCNLCNVLICELFVMLLEQECCYFLFVCGMCWLFFVFDCVVWYIELLMLKYLWQCVIWYV